MSAEHQHENTRVPLTAALRRHLVLIAVCVALGAAAGWAYVDARPTEHTSSARVLINPAVGNPFSPTPASVRQEELTSLETEAVMLRSAEVLDAAAQEEDRLSADALAARVQVTVLPNTQVLEITYSSTDPAVARLGTDAVAVAYLENRSARVEDVLQDRLSRLESQTERVVEDLRAATAGAQVGKPSERAFQAELADALRNELVNLRAQRTLLENSSSPVGRVISPASESAGPGPLVLAVPVAGGGVAGLLLGCLLALMVGPLRRRVSSVRSRSRKPAARAVAHDDEGRDRTDGAVTRDTDVTTDAQRDTAQRDTVKPDTVTTDATNDDETDTVRTDTVETDTARTNTVESADERRPEAREPETAVHELRATTPASSSRLPGRLTPSGKSAQYTKAKTRR